MMIEKLTKIAGNYRQPDRTGNNLYYIVVTDSNDRDGSGIMRILRLLTEVLQTEDTPLRMTVEKEQPVELTNEDDGLMEREFIELRWQSAS